MILPIIRGHKLDGYVLGTKLCPPEFLPRTTPGSTVKIPNPEYEEWLSNDQLLLGWLYNTMSSDIASQLMRKATSKELWMEQKNYQVHKQEQESFSIKHNYLNKMFALKDMSALHHFLGIEVRRDET
ncbi:hypothetical protein F511_10860 [Dorcoceras hygrometricum]|uniref:Uncharacterized protein n=1 Tax=Dorcoceras hygrometricum TaxID=472368 RepID=A0A2Z7C038_9LAMI|nr:hypothetical protein F511_10860 [Dorcoceras hygrometricum]